MPQPVLDELEAFYVLEPQGGAAEDYRLAFGLANLVQALTGGRSKKAHKTDPTKTPWAVKDFLIDRVPRRRRRTPVRRAEREMTPEETVVHLAQVLGVPMTAALGSVPRGAQGPQGEGGLRRG